MFRAALAALLLAALALSPLAVHAEGTNVSVVVVSNCATPPPGGYNAGEVRMPTMDTSGLLCSSATATGTFDDAAVSATGSGVPGSASYDGINVGGTLRGATGVNPSGSIYATQVDLASVAGATVKTGAGTASGAIRVELPTNGTGVVGLVAGTAVIGHVIVDSGGIAVTNAGTFAVQCALCSTAAGQTTNHTDLAAILAKQPALGTAGTPSTDVLSIQGVSGGTVLPVVTGGNSFANITTATTTTVRSGAGVLHTLCVNSLGTVASAAVMYDNTAGSGTKIGTVNTLALLGCQTYDIAFSTGLTIVTTGTVAPDLTISYRATP